MSIYDAGLFDGFDEDFRICSESLFRHMCVAGGQGVSYRALRDAAFRALPEGVRYFSRRVFSTEGEPVRLSYAEVIAMAVVRMYVTSGVFVESDRMYYLSAKVMRSIPSDVDDRFYGSFSYALGMSSMAVLERMRAKIDFLYLDRRLFFRPWIGESYIEGITDKRVLILGASGYCEQSGECRRAEDCRDLRGSRARYWTLEKDCLMGEGGVEGLSLSTFNERVIRSYLRQREAAGSGKACPETYRRFDEKMLDGYLPCRNSSDIWNHVSFFNFLTVMLGNDSRLTPGYETGGEAYADSYDVMMLLLDVLRPDRIILWGSRVKNYLASRKVLDDTFIPIMHPSSWQFGRGEGSLSMLERVREEFNPR